MRDDGGISTWIVGYFPCAILGPKCNLVLPGLYRDAAVPAAGLRLHRPADRFIFNSTGSAIAAGLGASITPMVHPQRVQRIQGLQPTRVRASPFIVYLGEVASPPSYDKEFFPVFLPQVNFTQLAVSGGASRRLHGEHCVLDFTCVVAPASGVIKVENEPSVQCRLLYSPAIRGYRREGTDLVSLS